MQSPLISWKPTRIVVWGVFAILVMLVATLALRNYSLRYDNTELKEMNRILMLAMLERDPAYLNFRTHFPGARPSYYEGAVEWSQTVEQHGVEVRYSCRYDLLWGVRLFRETLRDKRVEGNRNVLSPEAFAGHVAGLDEPSGN